MVKMSGSLCDDDIRDGIEDEVEEEVLVEVEEEEGEEMEGEECETDNDGDRDDNDEPVEVTESSRASAFHDVVLDDLAEAEAECARSEGVVVQCKAALKSAKADYDEAVLHLRSLCQGIANDKQRPLMPAFQEAEKGTEKVVGKETEVSIDAGEVEDEKPDWRLAPLSDLAIPDGILSKLYESDIETVGELEDLRSEISTGKAKWPKGIGAAKVTTIEDAVIQWLTVNQG